VLLPQNIVLLSYHSPRITFKAQSLTAWMSGHLYQSR
jgi:hypothetical protein